MHVLPHQLHAQRCTCTCRLSECVSLCRVSAARDDFTQPLAIELMIASVKEEGKAQREKKNKEEAGDSERSGGTTENYTDDKGATERQKWGSEA